MTTDTTPADGAVERAVLALHSAIRRRGVAAMDGDQAGEVRAIHNARMYVVRFDGTDWLMPIPGTDRHTVIAHGGEEGFLARWLANELLGLR
ncbi:hypothetical protein [Nocardiopsis eucommiae]|uniref:hypothetical protein n=1 Tax=Nocardiopsis eucommiae TaxID=2831970 RepID=UPI003D762D8C